MKQLFTLFILSAVHLNVFSQITENHKRDSLLRSFLLDQCYCEELKCPPNRKAYYSDKQVLSTYSLNRILRKDLTKITLNEDGLPSLGNYATSQLSEDKSKITLNTSIYNPFGGKNDSDPVRSILSINIKAGTKDNISALFSNKNVNNEVGITAKWSIISKKKTNYKNADQIACNDLKIAREYLFEEYKNTYQLTDVTRQSFNSKHKYLLNSLREKVENIEKLITSKKREIDSLKSIVVDTNELAEFMEREMLLLDSLKFEFDNKTTLYYKTLAEYSNNRATLNLMDSSKIIDSFYNRLLIVETKLVKWDNFKLSWMDIEVSGTGEEYLLVNKALPLDSQLSKKSFSRWSIGVTKNIFSSYPFLCFRYGSFVKFGYSMSNDNSLTNETPKDIITTYKIDSAQEKREIIEKQRGYDKEFSTNFRHNFSLRVSNYLNSSLSQAISFTSVLGLKFSKIKSFYKVTDKPVFTPGIAYLYAFQNKEKDKNTINIEVFLNFSDVFNSLEDNSKFYERHELGLKFGVPFNSIFLN